MKYNAKSIILGRKPRAKPEHEFKTAFFKLFDGDHPLRGQSFPIKELEFENIDYITFDSAIVEYYLEGNDLVFRGINAISIEEKENHVLHITVE